MGRNFLLKFLHIPFTGKGIDHYTEETYQQLRNELTKCLLLPFQNRIVDDRDVIPLYFGATGGMRLLR